MIPAFERAKTVHALDCAATVISEQKCHYCKSLYGSCVKDINYEEPLLKQAS
jgi:hypothetical protein